MGRILNSYFAGIPESWVWSLVLATLTVMGFLAGLFIATQSVLYVVIALTGLGFVMSELVEPLIGVIVSLWVGPLSAWLQIANPGLPERVGQVAFALAVASWMARALVRRDMRLPQLPLFVPLLVLLGVYLLSLWAPADPWVGFLEFAKWAQVFLVFLIVAQRIEEGPQSAVAGSMAVGLIGGGLLQAAVGVWQFALRGDGPEPFLIDGRFYRAYGTFQQPNPYAGFVGMTAAVAVGLVVGVGEAWLREQKRTMSGARRCWQVIGVGLLTAATSGLVLGLIGSWSRGGWMGFAAALLVMAALLPRRSLWGVAGVAAFLGLGWVAFRAGWLPAAISERMTGFLAYTRFADVRGVAVTDVSYAVLERMAHWQAALAMWRDHFWLGVGLGCYEPAYSAYRLANWPLALGHAHNAYLNILAETGLLGLGAYLLWLAVWGVRLVRAMRRRSGWHRGLALGLIGAWVHFAVHSLVDNLLVNDVHLHVGVMLALSAWLISFDRNGIDDDEQ